MAMQILQKNDHAKRASNARVVDFRKLNKRSTVEPIQMPQPKDKADMLQILDRVRHGVETGEITELFIGMMERGDYRVHWSESANRYEMIGMVITAAVKRGFDE